MDGDKMESSEISLNKKYSISNIKNNLIFASFIKFKYQDYFIKISANMYANTYKKKKILVDIDHNNKRETILFDNSNDLFEQLVIGENKLTDIWNEIEVIETFGIDKSTDKNISYDIEYLKKYFLETTVLYIKYHHKDYYIGFKRYKNEFNLFRKKREILYCIENCRNQKEIQEFKTPKELFENATIEGKKLKEIWNDVIITDIAGIKLKAKRIQNDALQEKKNFIKFNDIIKVLPLGCTVEIEIQFQKKTYWICFLSKKKKYVLYESYDIDGEQEFDSLLELYKNGKIEDKKLEEIWDFIEDVTINSCDPVEFVRKNKK